MEQGDFSINVKKQCKLSHKMSCWTLMLRQEKNLLQNIHLNCYHLLIDDKPQVKKQYIFTQNKAQPSRTAHDVEVRLKPDVKVSLTLSVLRKTGKNPCWRRYIG